MKFTKMNGIGNDYVYIDCTKEVIDNPSEVAIKVSERHFGIGSDGLILIKSSDKADFCMDMYNADGSRGMMCGNGIRCVGKYVYDNGLTDKTTITIETLSGIKTLELNVVDGKMKTARVNMGEPILTPDLIPVTSSFFHNADNSVVTYDKIVSKKLKVNGKDYDVTCVSMGNPHAIVYLDNSIDIKEFDIESVGPYFEKHGAFPQNINTEFIQVVDRHTLNMRVWERGSGETWACGTGACASLVATVLNGYCDNEVTIHLIGGDLSVSWNREDGNVYMEGTAEVSFTGEIEL